jgi:PEP-CTERM motif
MKKYAVLLTVLLASTATVAQAGTFFTNVTGLAAPGSTVTFDELSLPDETAITNQYAPFGVTLNNAFLNVQDGFVPRNYVTNFSFSRGVQNGDLQITFGSLVTDAAFDLVTNFGNSTFNIYSGATLIDSAVFLTSTSPVNFYGYTGSSFDRIQIIAPGNNALEVGTVQFSANAVPEPASWALMIAGFGLVGAAARRRQSVRVAYA